MRNELTFEQGRDIGLKFVLDMLEPASPYGAKLLKDLRFYKASEKAELDGELDNVSVMLTALENEHDKVSAVRHTLSAMRDVSGTIKNCSDGVLTEIDLFELTALLLRLKELIPLAESLPGYESMTGARLEEVDAPLAVLDPEGNGRLRFFVEDTRTPQLMRLRLRKRELEKSLYMPDADKDLILSERMLVTSREEQELLSIYAVMTDSLRPMLPILNRNIAAVGRLDVAISKALLARRFSGTRPETGGDSLLLEEAVNPEIAQTLKQDGRSFTPITVDLPRGVTILTGANMGGKSVAIKTIALNIVLALTGFFVFAAKAKIPVFDHTELINRDFSSVSGGLSSFGGEILRFNDALKRLGGGDLSFIAMDEFARGTNSEEGAAIVRGVVRYLNDSNAVTILATHYDGAAEFASRRYQVRGLRSLEENAPVKEGDAAAYVAEHMDYGLMRIDKNADCPREALLICRLLRMDEELIGIIEEG